MHDDPQYLRQALKHGASGYVLKKAADAELISAIQAVLRGEMYVHPSMTRVLLEDILPETKFSNADLTWSNLSEREQGVLKMVALGHTSAEIAEQLSLSAKTVETYRARYGKTWVANKDGIGQICPARGFDEERIRSLGCYQV
jgi:two-component system response regulator NreC